MAKTAKKEKQDKKELKLRMYEIVYTPKNPASRTAKSKVKAILSILEKEFQSGNIKDYAWGIHDKDVYVEQDKELGRLPEGKNIGDLKPWHLHLGFVFKSPRKISTVANLFDVKENTIERIKSKNFADYLLYLTHRNRPEKYQYPDDIVHTTIQDWKRKRNVKQAKNEIEQAGEMVPLFVKQIALGELTLRDCEEAFKRGDMVLAYAYLKNKAMFLEAYKMYLGTVDKKRKIAKKVVYVFGESGYGKSYFATETLRGNLGLSENQYFISGGSNDTLQEYKGEPLLVFDDARVQLFKFEDWLKILNEYENFVAPARYRNILILADTIVITCMVPFEQFCSDMLDNAENDEDIYQFVRRVTDVYNVGAEKIEHLVFSKSERKHIFEKYIPNEAPGLDERLKQEKEKLKK